MKRLDSNELRNLRMNLSKTVAILESDIKSFESTMDLRSVELRHALRLIEYAMHKVEKEIRDQEGENL